MGPRLREQALQAVRSLEAGAAKIRQGARELEALGISLPTDRVKSARMLAAGADGLCSGVRSDLRRKYEPIGKGRG